MNTLFIVVIVIFMVIVAVITVFRLRRGGPGPQVNWIPRSLRGRVNDDFEKNGWQKPYDEDGNRNPDRDKI